MGHPTSLDGDRRGLRGFATTLRPELAGAYVNLVSLDARTDDRATWCAVTITADPVGDLAPNDTLARVVAVAEYNVDGGGKEIQFEVGRLTTINLPAGFVRVRVALRDGHTATWAVNASCAAYAAGGRDARARVVQTVGLEESGTFSAPVVPNCTDAEVIFSQATLGTFGQVQGAIEGRQTDATIVSQRVAIMGFVCALPYTSPVAEWHVRAAGAGTATLVQYLGP